MIARAGGLPVAEPVGSPSLLGIHHFSTSFRRVGSFLGWRSIRSHIACLEFGWGGLGSAICLDLLPCSVSIFYLNTSTPVLTCSTMAQFIRVLGKTVVGFPKSSPMWLNVATWLHMFVCREMSFFGRCKCTYGN